MYTDITFLFNIQRIHNDDDDDDKYALYVANLKTTHAPYTRRHGMEFNTFFGKKFRQKPTRILYI